MALPALATVEDLETWTGSLENRESLAAAVLSQVSNRVRQYLGRTYQDEPAPEIVQDVVIRVATRFILNPEALDSVSIDDGTKRWGAVRGMSFDADDLADLAPHRTSGSLGGLGVISTTRGDAGDSTIYVPTGPPPSGYPFPWYDSSDVGG